MKIRRAYDSQILERIFRNRKLLYDSKRRPSEVNIEVGITLHSEVRDKLIPVAKKGLGNEDFVPVPEEDFDLYFDLVIDKLKITTK